MGVFGASVGLALPMQLTIQPKGTNQVELTMGPAVQGGVYGVMVRSNGYGGHWTVFGTFYGSTSQTLSATCNLGGGMSVDTLDRWKFVAGPWNGTPGYDIPPIAKELIFRVDPSAYVDPNACPLGDGWSNLQKFQNNLDPFVWQQPFAPKMTVQFFQGTNGLHRGRAMLSWYIPGWAKPDYFIIERANRTLRPRTNSVPFARPGPNGINGFSPTNRPPNFRPFMNRSPSGPREDPFVTGPFEVVARFAEKSDGMGFYRYADPDVDAFPQPSYRVTPHFSPPLHAFLKHVDAAEIRKTMLHVTSVPTTNGYALTLDNPIPDAWYLLMVRDKHDLQWRASGYFSSGTNRESIHLQVDKKGMMSDGQTPISLPPVKFLPDVVEPQFTAGWGEDSDGDGLPDIYEVLVTQTDPTDADTGNTGMLDGYKDMAVDGWSALEKFRRRSDPLKTAHPPATVELIKPTGRDILKAIAQQTDLPYELQLEARTNGAVNFEPIEKLPVVFYSALNFRQANERKDFDVRVSWRIPQEQPHAPDDPQYTETPSPEQTIETLEGQADMLMFKAFTNELGSGPALSKTDVSNRLMAIEHAYRSGQMDKGIVMVEMMLLKDYQSQDFYGRVLDQNGDPVAGAKVKVMIALAQGGPGTSLATQTDASGLFQFSGIKGESLNIMPEKAGYQIEGHGLGLKGLNGPDTSPQNRAIYTMWKLKGPEPMRHQEFSTRKIEADGRTYTIDLMKNVITEGTNTAGDILIQIKRPPQVKPRENFDWSFAMTAIDGGFIEVTNEIYLNEAPINGYQNRYQMDRYATNVVNYSTYSLYRTDRTFFLKSRGGQVYGHFKITELDPAYRDGAAALRIEFYLNPSRSRNLEFDPAKQIR
jgi:hypothetical protein